MKYWTLLDFVKTYLRKKLSIKKKEIIAQEYRCLKMKPVGVCFWLVSNMYPKHPVHIDIAGFTVDSIMINSLRAITRKLQTFYHPSNMNFLL